MLEVRAKAANPEQRLARGDRRFAAPADQRQRLRVVGIDLDPEEPQGRLGAWVESVHWFNGAWGYFPTYTIGNLYSAMLLETLQKEVPALWDAVGRGDLKVVLEWLRTRIHRQGFLEPAEELIQRVTGKKLTEAPFIDYLGAKYRPLYGLPG